MNFVQTIIMDLKSTKNKVIVLSLRWGKKKKKRKTTVTGFGTIRNGPFRHYTMVGQLGTDFII